MRSFMFHLYSDLDNLTMVAISRRPEDVYSYL